MKAKIALIAFCLLHLFKNTTVMAQDPTFEWVGQIGGGNNDDSRSIAVDSSGNVYTIGRYRDSTDVDPGSDVFNLISNGEIDIFIQKLDVNGNFVWAKNIGGEDNDLGLSITLDHLGNIYTTGSFGDTVDFDPGTGTSNLISNGNRDIFIQKLNSNGDFIWAKQLGGSSYDEGVEIKTDNIGNVYITGVFSETVDFDPGPGITNLISNGDKDIFIQKLDAQGNFIWAKQMGGTLADVGTSIIVDDTGNVYTSCTFKDTVDFDPGIGISNLISMGSYDMAIQKLDSNGNFIWVKQMGGIDYDRIQTLTLDNNGNIYSTGSFQDTVDFDPGNGITNLIASDKDIFIQKLDNNGNFVWAKQMGGIYLDQGESITLDNDGNIYSTGQFRYIVDFDPGSGVANMTSTSAGNSIDAYIQKLDNNGNFIWAKQINGTYNDNGHQIVVDHLDNIYVTGIFEQTSDFDPGTGVANLTSAGFRDSYVLKLSQCYPDPFNFDLAALPNLTHQCLVDTLNAPTASNGCHTFSGTTSTSFPISTLGTTVVTWTYDDGNGTSISQNQQVIISGDVTSPEPDSTSLPALSAFCEVPTVDAPTAVDNCSGALTATSSVSFPFTDQSINQIVWTFDDGNGNTSTQNQVINWTGMDLSTSLNNFTISASNSNATYQWLNCDNGYSPISGENNISFTATANGNYAVELIENGCVDTSECVSITTIGVNEFEQTIKLVVYPNPSSDVFNLTFKDGIKHGTLSITDIQGKLVQEKTIDNTSSTSINLKDEVAGVYLLTLRTKTSQKTLELIKE